MNISQKQLDDDARFDRLVDGVLSPAEYKALVAALEDEPGGWRRCALAFLEAQAWRKEFSAIRRTDDAMLRPEPTTLRRRTNVSVFTLLCVAASLVLAFGLGIFVHGRLFPPSPAATLITQSPQKARGPANGEGKEGALGPEASAIEMRFVVDRGEGLSPEEIVVPVRESTNGGAETLVETEPAISDSVLRSLQLRGHRINRKQELIPIPLEDGRQVILPVEKYQITPVSSRSY